MQIMSSSIAPIHQKAFTANHFSFFGQRANVRKQYPLFPLYSKMVFSEKCFIRY